MQFITETGNIRVEERHVNAHSSSANTGGESVLEGERATRWAKRVLFKSQRAERRRVVGERQTPADQNKAGFFVTPVKSLAFDGN